MPPPFGKGVSDAVVHDWCGVENYRERMYDEVHIPLGEGTTDFRE